MADLILTWLSFACLGLAAVGSVYTLAATVAVRRFFRSPQAPSTATPGVTILKPLHGDEPGLYANLRSFCTQGYDGPVQIVFGVQDPADPAIAVVRRLIADFPGHDLDLVIDEQTHGRNRKVANLINMSPRIAHEVVVLADSDMRVGPDYLRRVLGALEEPGAGLVTCLYRGAPDAGIVPRLAAMAIDYQFLPSVVMGLALRLARPCFGSTIALRRATLAAIGGFAAFRDHLADDNEIGAAVRRLGLRVVVPPFVVDHACTETSLAGVFYHELRWARTIRAVDPVGFLGSMVTYPLPFALLGGLFAGFGELSLYIIALAGVFRLVLQAQLDHSLATNASALSSRRRWLGPVRDLLSFLVFIASFFVGTVRWRGHRYEVQADGTVIPMKEAGS